MSEGKLTKVSADEVRAEVARVRAERCPSCSTSEQHTPVDIDGPMGEYLRYCHACGTAFRVEERL